MFPVTDQSIRLHAVHPCVWRKAISIRRGGGRPLPVSADEGRSTRSIRLTLMMFSRVPLQRGFEHNLVGLRCLATGEITRRMTRPDGPWSIPCRPQLLRTWLAITRRAMTRPHQNLGTWLRVDWPQPGMYHQNPTAVSRDPDLLAHTYRYSQV